MSGQTAWFRGVLASIFNDLAALKLRRALASTFKGLARQQRQMGAREARGDFGGGPPAPEGAALSLRPPGAFGMLWQGDAQLTSQVGKRTVLALRSAAFAAASAIDGNTRRSSAG